MFGGLGTQEIILIFLIILLLFGAKRIPEIGRALGKGIREFKNASREITSAADEESAKPATPPPPGEGETPPAPPPSERTPPPAA
jgi:sec-independent protein translocase protein TatA